MIRYGSKTCNYNAGCCHLCAIRNLLPLLCSRNVVSQCDTKTRYHKYCTTILVAVICFLQGIESRICRDVLSQWIRWVHQDITFLEIWSRFFIFSKLVNTLVQSPLLWGKACAGSYFQIFDMASTSGYIGVKHVQEVGPRFFGMSSV